MREVNMNYRELGKTGLKVSEVGLAPNGWSVTVWKT